MTDAQQIRPGDEIPQEMIKAAADVIRSYLDDYATDCDAFSIAQRALEAAFDAKAEMELNQVRRKINERVQYLRQGLCERPID